MEEPLAIGGGTAVALVVDKKKASKNSFQQAKTLKPVIPIEAPSDDNTTFDGNP